MGSTAVRVLLVDDDAAFVAALEAMLETDGFRVVGWARNGADAIEAAARTQPHVVTMDLDMPLVDGVTAIETIVSLGIPVVVVTGSDSIRRLEEALTAGAAALVAKRDVAMTLSRQLRAVVHEDTYDASTAQAAG